MRIDTRIRLGLERKGRKIREGAGALPYTAFLGHQGCPP